MSTTPKQQKNRQKTQGSLLDGYLTQHQLADELNVDKRTLQLWQSRRIGPPVTLIGRSTYYLERDVRNWLESRPITKRGQELVAAA